MGMIREVKEPKLNRLQYMHIDEVVNLGARLSDDGDVWPHDGASHPDGDALAYFMVVGNATEPEGGGAELVLMHVGSYPVI